MEHRFTSLPPDPFMCSSDEKKSRSPLALYSEYQRMDIELRPPHAMPTSHWHGQVEVNVPFDGDVEYLINNEVVRIEKGYITLFWACTPHQLTRPGDCQQMAIFNLPMHLFLSWPLDRELINHVTHGMVIKSLAAQQLSAFEVRRWQQELSHENEQIRQLAIDEIALMLKRLSDTDKTILDIALTAGFRSSSRFYSTFTRYVGMPPQQYRKLSQQRRHGLALPKA